MGLTAFEGPAGCGKTHRLMHELTETLRARPLASHERVLALTYMQGSRRRLDARLREVEGLHGRFEAITMDSLALQLVQRWRRLAAHLGHATPAENAFEANCVLAAQLLQHAEVRRWLHLSFPILVVDEAQDLSHARSAMLRAQAELGQLLLAFDEFQCLSPALLPVPILRWIGDHGEPTQLAGSRRTSEQELIAAAKAVRAGAVVPVRGRQFRILPAPGGLAAWHLCDRIRSRSGGTVAILTPSRSGTYADAAVTRAGERPIGTRSVVGPYSIPWEADPKHDLDAFWETLGIVDGSGVAEALSALSPHTARPDARAACDWIRRKRSTCGLTEVSGAELRHVMQRAVSVQRRFGHRAERPVSAMTIHQAKNREFDHVVVMWPFQVRDHPDQKRRLLYNAITRSRRSCLVLLQREDMLNAPPFATSHATHHPPGASTVVDRLRETAGLQHRSGPS